MSRERPILDIGRQSTKQELATARYRGAYRVWQISDDLPRPTPVGRAEIEILEVYLGAQIDDLLRRMREEDGMIESLQSA